MYDTGVILDDLDITYGEFKEICIITGCDYVKKHQRSLQSTMELFDKYREEREHVDSFYKWVIANTDYFDRAVEFDNISELFSLHVSYNNFVRSIQLFNSAPNNKDLTNILSNYGFIFV